MSTQPIQPHVALRPYLRDGEELLWTGRPYTSVKYRPHWIKIAAAIFFGASALSWEVDTIRDLLIILREDPEFAVFEILFALIGLAVVISVFPTLWMMLTGAKRNLQRTAYGVTDSRVLILYPQKKAMTLQEYMPKNLPSIDFQQEKDGTGTITFSNDEDNGGDSELGKAFYHIDDAHHVYELISGFR